MHQGLTRFAGRREKRDILSSHLHMMLLAELPMKVRGLWEHINDTEDQHPKVEPPLDRHRSMS